MIDFTHNPIIPADYKSRGRGLPYEASPFRRLFMDLYLQSSLWQFGGWTAVSLFYSGAAYGPERRPTSEKVRKATPPDADKLVELRGRLGPDWPKLPKS